MRIEPDIAQMIAEHSVAMPYRQIKAMTTGEYREWLRDREVRFLSWETIHWLWSVGLIVPVTLREEAIKLTPDLSVGDRFVEMSIVSDQQLFADTGVDVKSVGIMPDWHRNLDGALIDSLLWHPFQFHRFSMIHKLLEPNFIVEMSLYGPENYARAISDFAERVPEGLVSFAEDSRDPTHSQLLALLLAVEPLIHPQVHGSVSWNPLQESFEGYLEWRQLFDRAAAVHRTGLCKEEVAEWHRQLSIQAQLSDPVEHFRTLLQHAHRDDKKRLAGPVLAAYELYGQAESLRRFAEEYWGEKWWEEDDYRGGPGSIRFKKRQYGTSRPGDANREQLWRILRDYGLDPQTKALWLLEGDTEVAFFRRLAELEGLDLDRAGLELLSLGGKDRNSKDKFFRRILQHSRTNGAFTFMALDEESKSNVSHLDDMKKLAEQGLLTAGYMVWRPDFESANFTEEELVDAACQLASSVDPSIEITVDELERRMTEKKEPVGTAISGILSYKRVYSGKGPEWGESLADIAHSDPGNRPAIEAFRKLARSQYADFDATLEHLVVGPEGFLVEKPETDGRRNK
ncbi:MAG: hypothetical protein KF883_13435 [Thermomicrobiales bacterium]|nr:hypothetical protein [Thermomicrobiales bacterium]